MGPGSFKCVHLCSSQATCDASPEDTMRRGIFRALGWWFQTLQGHLGADLTLGLGWPGCLTIMHDDSCEQHDTHNSDPWFMGNNHEYKWRIMTHISGWYGLTILKYIKCLIDGSHGWLCDTPILHPWYRHPTGPFARP